MNKEKTMCLAFMVLIFGTSLSAYGAAEGSAERPSRWLPVDQEGWTILRPTEGTRLIYVSSSAGDDDAARFYSPDDPAVGLNPFRSKWHGIGEWVRLGRPNGLSSATQRKRRQSSVSRTEFRLAIRLGKPSLRVSRFGFFHLLCLYRIPAALQHVFDLRIQPDGILVVDLLQDIHGQCHSLDRTPFLTGGRKETCVDRLVRLQDSKTTVIAFGGDRWIFLQDPIGNVRAE